MNNHLERASVTALAVRAVVMLIAMLSLLLLVFFKPVVVDGPSMKHTLEPHDYLIAAKYLTFKPHRGDIALVLLDSGRKTPGRLLIKRIVGVPGDRVSIEKGQLIVNGSRLTEPYLGSRDATSSGEITLKQDEYYVLGDNRIDSIDSRSLGAIRAKELQGRVVLRVMPMNRFGAVQ